MSQPISHKLIVRDDGQMFVVSGNPTVGYKCQHATLEPISDHKRSWQAVTAAGEWAAVEPTEAERFEGEVIEQLEALLRKAEHTQCGCLGSMLQEWSQ